MTPNLEEATLREILAEELGEPRATWVREGDGMHCVELSSGEALAAMRRVSTPTLRNDVWQPIETAPKDGRVILAPVDFQPFVALLSWCDDDTDWIDDFGMVFHPTHWMPLPSPPQPPLTEVER
jgi:hypothetical protein